MSITRRTALQTMAAAGAIAAVPAPLRAREAKRAGPEAVAVLYDPVLCVGCRECIEGCAESNGCLAGPEQDPELTPDTLTILERYVCGDAETYRKVQCMHCVDPACVSACMLGAMEKNADGSVTWNGDLCVGCRYCEIACPFNVPRFEWDTPVPELRKCELCPERRAQGLRPACVDKCRRDALVFGSRTEMLAEAHRRIAERPDAYNPRVYGEEDGGGTSVLYLAAAGVAFADMGLPELGMASVPSLPEKIQHTLYKGFVAPLVLLGIFGAIVRRNTRRVHEEERAAHEHAHSAPVGGRLLTWPVAILALLAAIGLITVAWRFAAGLGAVTNLNDGYPMGLWIAFDVVTGTALACGGYAMALLVYVANRGRYHPLVRAAIVTSALGYTLGGLSVLIDIGRAWNFYKIPLYFWSWNVNSILLEVALCIMFYTMVLWIEVSPAFFEQWRTSPIGGLRRFAIRMSPKLERALPYFIAVGLVLPTMHQSSLGSLMLLSGQKLHPLWSTPLLPLLFLVSVVGMGYAAVTLESTISARAFERPQETPMLRALGTPIAGILLGYAALRLADVAHRGQLQAVAALDEFSLLFLLEMALFVLPALGLLVRRRSASAGYLAAMAVFVILAGALYRFSTYLIAFEPGPEWSYFPSPGEFAVTIGLVSAELLGYILLVKRFPILRAAPEALSAPVESGPEPLSVAPGAGGMREAVATGAAIVVLLLATAAPIDAQQTRRARGDLRCLTADPATCLDEPVSPSEPHEAVCATCHDLGRQARVEDAKNSCASADCHADDKDATPFHRGIAAVELNDCITCHPAHDARIPRGGANCTFCHQTGGRGVTAPRPARERAVGLRLAMDEAGFGHDRHRDVRCVECHSTRDGHGTVEVSSIADCRSCHHQPPRAVNCQQCHTRAELVRTERNVTRDVEIHTAPAASGARRLPFGHSAHLDIACTTCHTGQGLALSANRTECTSCHEQHHDVAAVGTACLACHRQPPPEAHTRQAHLGCGGVGCHETAAERIRMVPKERDFCLVCHQDMVEHEPTRNCAECHALPPAREARQRRPAVPAGRTSERPEGPAALPAALTAALRER